MKLEFTQIALHDLKRLREFIAIKSPQSARRYSQSLRTALNNLVDQPHMGRLLDEERQIRELIAGDYLARYQVLDDRITIIGIRHRREARELR